MKIRRPSFLPPRSPVRGADPIPKAYKPYLIASLAVLLVSLLLLVVVVGLSFGYFSHAGMPLWVLILGGLAVLGIGLGFAGFAGMMAMAGWTAWREGRKVQVLPPPER